MNPHRHIPMPSATTPQPRGNTKLEVDDMGGSVASSYIGATRAGLEAPKDTPILLMASTPTKKTKLQAPQDAIDDFWEKFTSKTPGKATTILPKNTYVKKAGEEAPKGVIKGENAVASYEEAAKTCKEKVANIVKECRRVNQKYRDTHFDIEFDLKWGVRDCLSMLTKTPDDCDAGFGPGSVKRVGDIFDDPKFYLEGPTANDVRQGRDGDCWFMAALCTLGNKPGLIEKVCVARDEMVGVYGFVFHRDGEWRSEVIDDKLYLTKPDYDESWVERNLIEDRQRINSEEDYRQIYQSNSGALYFAQCEDPNETWLPLMEKAYAKAHGDYAAIEGGFTGEGLEDLTGGVTTELFSSDILDKEYFWKEELMKVNKDFLFGCASGIFWGRGLRKGIYEGHAYSIMRAVEIDGKRLCLLRNPWGEGEWTGAWSDGSKEWTPEWMQKLEHRFGDDGAFWMSYDDLLKKYQTFDRTRLFTDDWKVTQGWTSLDVPWTVAYHDTKFSFTLEKKAPVVIVLSQLDERYFRGLEGQYHFELSFRVHKAGEEDYIIRSHGNYWMRRSVTAELELEEGEYHVLMKVEAVRDTEALPVEQIVRNNAKQRRDKLLRIGLAYDLAHAKGLVTETEDEKKSKKELEKKKKAKEVKELGEKLMKEKKRRKHVANKELRKQREAKSKRKEKEKARSAKKEVKAKEAKDKVKKEDETKSEVPGKADDTETKADEKVEATVPLEAVTSTEAEPSPIVEDPKLSDSLTPKKAEKPSILLNNGSAPPSLIEFFDDSDNDSDLESVVSDISTGVIEEELAAAKLVTDAAAAAALPIVEEKEEDEFEKDPWNAVAVVGLRVYSKGSCVSVKVLRGVGEGRKGKGEVEGKLDVDDSARDATKGIDVDDEKTENKNDDAIIVEKKAEVDEGSEGSGVVV